MNLLKSMLSAVTLGSLLLAVPAMAQTKSTVGIAMPTKSSARWIDDGNNIVKVLKERGYNTDLQYAEDDIPNQLSQIENMVTKGAKVLVIASIDGTTLSDVLKQAKDKGVTVIAYDNRLEFSLQQIESSASDGTILLGNISSRGPWELCRDGEMIARDSGDALDVGGSLDVRADDAGVVVRCPDAKPHVFVMTFAGAASC